MDIQDINVETGTIITNPVTVDAPTLLQPVRLNSAAAVVSGIGEIRVDTGEPGDCAGCWQNGDIWLDKPGTYNVRVWSQAEDRSLGLQSTLHYRAVRNPSPEKLQEVMLGIGAGRAAYHAEWVDDTWNQVMKLEQRLVVKHQITLSCTGGPIRYRWGGPPGNVNGVLPDGIAYDRTFDGDADFLSPAPLASLWVRKDGGDPTAFARVNLISQRLR